MWNIKRYVKKIIRGVKVNIKGFTLIEVVVALSILMILTVSIADMNLVAAKTSSLSRNKDLEYNIARSFCEKFRGEAGLVEDKTVVVYLDSLDEAVGTICDILSYGVVALDTNYDNLKYNNFDAKRFAVVLKAEELEYLKVLKVAVFFMGNRDSGVTLRIARL